MTLVTGYVWRVQTSHFQSCHCDNNTSGRKTSVCIQELFAGVGVLHLEGRSAEACHDPASAEVAETARLRRPGVLPPPREDEAGSALSLEVARLREEAETGRRRITELEDQVLVYIIYISMHYLHNINALSSHPRVEEQAVVLVPCNGCDLISPSAARVSADGEATDFPRGIQAPGQGYRAEQQQQRIL